MLRRFLGLLCFFIFYGGSGLHSYLFNFDMNFGNYYQHLLSQFINELVTTNYLEGGAGRTQEQLQPIVDVYFGLSEGNYPHDVIREFHLRKIAQVVICIPFLFLGLWLFKSSYKSKNRLEER